MMNNDNGILFKRDCFTGETLYIRFEDLFPGEFESVATMHKHGESIRIGDMSEWARKAYGNVRLLMLAGF